MTITNTGHNCRGRHRANPWYDVQQADPRIFLGDKLQPAFIPVDTSVKCHKVLAKIIDHLIGNLGQVQHVTCQNILGKSDDPRETFRDVNAELSDHTTQAIDQLCALPDKQTPRAMERQQSLLFDCLYRNEPHRRARHCFTKGLGINGVGLAAFDIWFDIYRWDQPNIMANIVNSRAQ